jgi:hypothetical protein
LTIVRAVVELHGGTVRAESRGLGLGARFSVRLPLLSSLARAERNGQEERMPVAPPPNSLLTPRVAPANANTNASASASASQSPAPGGPDETAKSRAWAPV